MRKIRGLTLAKERGSAYGGAWDGKLVWGPLIHSRVTGMLLNPSYVDGGLNPRVFGGGGNLG